ncbi:hypothetical protein BDV19DRAFT_393848 [Aspergillus venezuelensis]
MPPKRIAEDLPATSSQARTIQTSEQAVVSCMSRNLEGSYNEKNDYDTYECLCQPRVDGKMDVDDEDDEDPFASASESENEEDENDGPREKTDKCDTGKTCMCHKSAAENPEHPITVTGAGYQKFITK